MLEWEDVSKAEEFMGIQALLEFDKQDYLEAEKNHKKNKLS